MRHYIFALFLLISNSVFAQPYIISQDWENFDCHGSNLVEVADVVCAVWKGGPGSGKCNVDMQAEVGIWISRLVDGTWTIPVQIVTAPDSVCWTPTLVKLPSEELLLYYRLGKDPRHTIGLCKHSTDRGLTWSEAEILPAGILGPIKYKPVFDSKGNMICGSSVEAGAPEDMHKATACWIEIFPRLDNGLPLVP